MLVRKDTTVKLGMNFMTFLVCKFSIVPEGLIISITFTVLGLGGVGGGPPPVARTATL